MNESAKGDEFNELRKIRNSINYYGKEISSHEVMEVLTRIKKLRENIISLLKKEY